MKFRMSSNVAVRTKNMTKALDFYSRVLGFPIRSDNPALADLDAFPLNLFIIEDQKINGPVMELFVDDLEQARDELVVQGCKVLRWREKGHDCYLQDPFGIIFNLWESGDTNQ